MTRTIHGRAGRASLDASHQMLCRAAFRSLPPVHL
jgi:hypothetical protein